MANHLIHRNITITNTTAITSMMITTRTTWRNAIGSELR